MGKKLEADDAFMKLVAYVNQNRRPGTTLAYVDAEKATGVSMDRTGRDKLRRAILYNRLEYRIFRGEAFQLAEAKTSQEILGQKLMSIDSRIKRADRARSVLAYHFFKSLSKEEQNRFLFLQGMLGAIQGKADEARKGLYAKKTLALTPGQSMPPKLPEM